MKKNDFLQVKTLDIVSLIQKAKEIKAKIADLTLDKNMSKLKDLKVIDKSRKNLAQTLTVLRQKQLLTELESTKKELEKVIEEPEIKDKVKVKTTRKVKGKI